MTNVTLFSQIISKLDRSKFNKLVKEKQTDKHQKGFSPAPARILPSEPHERIRAAAGGNQKIKTNSYF